MPAQRPDGVEMAVDGAQHVRALGLVEIGEAAHVARARGVPVDAVAGLAQLRLGQQIGRPVAQPAADHGQQLARHGVQRIAAHAQRPHAQARGQDQGGAVAHMRSVCFLKLHINQGFRRVYVRLDTDMRCLLGLRRVARETKRLRLGYFVRISLSEAVIRSR